ncbi:hypothetical protein ABZX75_11945 [Streptomyces sp. NPDC003038]|uniref:hypothetical protein n=1 Tax=unclassified Streptomyces TaxID=2593676 RepID=UPI0033A339DE
MSDAPVDPAEVPVFTGDFPLLDAKVKAISAGGAKISTVASDVHSSFGGLQAFYQAPEADQLFATTKPVSDLGLKLSSDMCTIAGALGTYARDAEPIAKKLDQLKKEAETFRSKVAKDEKWREDGDLIDENLERRNKIAEVWTQFQDVEKAAHAKIVALVGGTPLKTDDGSHGEGMYGYDAETLKQSKSLPWGDAVEESIPAWQVWEHAWEFTKGFFVDGVWGTLKGLGGLVGFQGWDTFKQSWTGLAKLATGLAIMSVPGAGALFMAAPADKLPSWLRESRTAMKETGKALLAWDQWGSNPGRAAGAVTFNVITTITTGGTAGAVSGAGKADAVAKALSVAGKTGRVVDPMTYILKGAGASITKIGDVMAGLKGLGNIEIPNINVDGAIALPDGGKILPDGTIHLPSGAVVPEGALKLSDGNIKLPEGTTTFPPGTVKLPVDGPSQFMDPKGNIYDHNGSITQHAKDAKTDIVDTPKADVPKADTPAPVKAPAHELAGVGGRGGDDITRIDSDISDPVHVSDHTPGARPDTTPGGHAPDNMPRNSVDNTPHGGGHTETPSTTGHRNPIGGTADNGIHNSHTDPTTTGSPTHTDTPSTGGGGHGDTSSGGHDGPGIPHQGEQVGIHEGPRTAADHNSPGSAATPHEALSPDTHVGENGTAPLPGRGQKLLEQIDADGPRVTKAGDVITHVDGRPVADYLGDLARERSSAYLAAKESGKFARKQTGACVGAVMDLRTGTVIEGINGKSNVVIPLDKLHPTLKSRYDDLVANPVHPDMDHPLGHAEVKATNELLWMRTRQGLPDGPDVLAEMRASVEFPFAAHKVTGLPGRPAPFCANCHRMLLGVESSNKRFTGYPPSEENLIP